MASGMELYILTYRVQLASIAKTAIDRYSHALTKLIFFSGERNTFFSLTETAQEFSVIIDEDSAKELPAGDGISLCPDTWRLLQVCPGEQEGVEWTAQTGIVKSVTKPLADANITIVYMSTFQTDFVLVQQQNLELAVGVLGANFRIIDESLNDSTGHVVSSSGTSYGGHLAVALAKQDGPVASPRVQRKPAGTAGGDRECDGREYGVAVRRKRHPFVVHPNRLVLACLDTMQMQSIGLPIIKALFYAEGERRFFSFAMVDNDVSLVMDDTYLAELPSDALRLSDTMWRVIQIDDGPLGFEEAGVVAQFSEPLADNNVHIFYISTFTTDWILVNENELEVAVDALEERNKAATDAD